MRMPGISDLTPCHPFWTVPEGPKWSHGLLTYATNQDHTVPALISGLSRGRSGRGAKRIKPDFPDLLAGTEILWQHRISLEAVKSLAGIEIPSD